MRSLYIWYRPVDVRLINAALYKNSNLARIHMRWEDDQKQSEKLQLATLYAKYKDNGSMAMAINIRDSDENHFIAFLLYISISVRRSSGDVVAI